MGNIGQTLLNDYVIDDEVMESINKFNKLSTIEHKISYTRINKNLLKDNKLTLTYKSFEVTNFQFVLLTVKNFINVSIENEFSSHRFNDTSIVKFITNDKHYILVTNNILTNPILYPCMNYTNHKICLHFSNLKLNLPVNDNIKNIIEKYMDMDNMEDNIEDIIHISLEHVINRRTICPNCNIVIYSPCMFYEYEKMT